MALKKTLAQYALAASIFSSIIGCATMPKESAVEPEKPQERPAIEREAEEQEPLALGNENLFHHRYYSLVEDKTIGIMANHTTRDTIDTLIDDPNITVDAIFAPEHGLLNEIGAGKEVKDTTYRSVPVYGIYGHGSQRRISQDKLEGLDALLFEIQDIGTRHYTYISSMYLAMDSWADYTQSLDDDESHPFIVLDRPTTTNAHTLEGPVLEPEWQTFIGVGQIPNRYAMTIGELAQLFKGEADVMDGARYQRRDADDSYANVSDIELVVVPMTGYDRTKTYDELFDQDAFIPTSPNIPTVDSALHYIGTGLMDGTIIQEIVPHYDEKGYTQFEYIRLPFIEDQDDMVTFLEHAADTYDFPGVVLRTEEDPQTEQTNILHLDVYDTTNYNPTYTAMALIYTAATHYPDEEIFYSEQGKRVFNKGIGNDWFSQMLEDPNRPSFQDILEDIRYDVYDFNEIREQYLLYD